MIRFYVTGQTIRHASPNIAADSFNYLEAKFDFADNTWDGYDKWAHFRQGETEYTLNLMDDAITADMGLNLTIGEWEVFLTGENAGSRLTTIPIIISVYESGLINAPLGEMPMTVVEQVAFKAETALSMAQSVLSAAESGAFDGKDGESLEIVNYFDTLEQLETNVPAGSRGLYGVGTEPPFELYGWSDYHGAWRSNGVLQGAPGAQGEDGTTYTPSVDDSGFISWTNDGGKPNPDPVNIRGPQGSQGEPGKEGKGPYEFAQEGGYTGTEKTLMDALVYLPQHHTRHEAGGLDPISITGDMIPNGAVSATYTCSLPVDGWTASGNHFTNTVAVSGITADDEPVWDVLLSTDEAVLAQELEAFNGVYQLETAAGSCIFSATDKPTVALNIHMKAVRK